MRTANTVEMAADLDRIVALASDTERWPVILPHYRWVTLLDGGGDHKSRNGRAARTDPGQVARGPGCRAQWRLAGDPLPPHRRRDEGDGGRLDLCREP